MGFFISGEETETMKEFKAEYKNVIRLDTGTTTFNGKYPMPVIGEITSYYGERIHPIYGRKSFHTGIDIGAQWHAPIIAIAFGQVVDIGIDKSYGNFVLIKHELPDETFYTFYAHLSEVHAIPDQEVFQGDVIGLEGGDPDLDPFPGTSTGHHLHFEIRLNEEASSHVDPLPYLYTPEDEEENDYEEKTVYAN
jgi:murein DD-endopeptidase MepM/ murein hydrolase activator NlpD